MKKAQSEGMFLGYGNQHLGHAETISQRMLRSKARGIQRSFFNSIDELRQIQTYLSLKHDLVWDVGTGNGQAATQLAVSFKNAVATDPSGKKSNLFQRKKIFLI